MATYPTNSSPSFIWGGERADFKSLRLMHNESWLGPMVIYVDITTQIDATGLIPITQGPTRGLFVDQKGTLTGHDAFGNAFSGIILQAGYNPICVGGITSVTSITQIVGVW